MPGRLSDLGALAAAALLPRGGQSEFRARSAYARPQKAAQRT
ncbi:hypothetical protein [Streptomyces misionensis]